MTDLKTALKETWRTERDGKVNYFKLPVKVFNILKLDLHVCRTPKYAETCKNVQNVQKCTE